eukprot:4582713-Amphidinium_carterae.1
MEEAATAVTQQDTVAELRRKLHSPKKIYLAILHEDGFALTPDQTAQAETTPSQGKPPQCRHGVPTIWSTEYNTARLVKREELIVVELLKHWKLAYNHQRDAIPPTGKGGNQKCWKTTPHCVFASDLPTLECRSTSASLCALVLAKLSVKELVFVAPFR